MPHPFNAPILTNPSILHVSSRDILRIVRDQILRASGYRVTSCEDEHEARNIAQTDRFDLVLIDVHTEHHVKAAAELCTALKKRDPNQKVAFVCNWRVAILNECPDDIVRSEFDPLAFLNGVADALKAN